MASVRASKQCYLMDKDRQVFWHCTLRGKTTEITVGKAGKDPRHFPRRQHQSVEAAVKYVRKQVTEKRAAGYLLREDGRKHWTYRTATPGRGGKTHCH